MFGSFFLNFFKRKQWQLHTKSEKFMMRWQKQQNHLKLVVNWRFFKSNVTHLITNKKYYDETNRILRKIIHIHVLGHSKHKKNKTGKSTQVVDKIFTPIVRPDIGRIQVLCAHFQILCIAFSSIVIADFKSNFKIQMQILLFILDICWIS